MRPRSRSPSSRPLCPCVGKGAIPPPLIEYEIYWGKDMKHLDEIQRRLEVLPLVNPLDAPVCNTGGPSISMLLEQLSLGVTPESFHCEHCWAVYADLEQLSTPCPTKAPGMQR